MKISTPFIRNLALFLAFQLLHVSLGGAVSLGPGSIALLDGSLEGPEMTGAWERAASKTFMDPRLLVKGKKDTTLILKRWKEEGRILLSARETAGSAALEQIGILMEKAWSAYYTFSFNEALPLLGQVEETLSIPGDSRFRTRISFESRVLRGMILRACGDRNFADEFMRAAALDPEAVLAPDRYSPEVITAYNRVRSQVLERDPVSLLIAGTPADATVLLDGKVAGTVREENYDLFAGVHFIEVQAPGYEPWSTIIDISQWEHPSVKYNLSEAGPHGEPARFFRGRLETGDKHYLSHLAQRLDVDYLLIPEGQGEVLKCWLVGADGVALRHVVLWNGGEDLDVAAQRMSDLLGSLRFEWGNTAWSSLSEVSFPENQVSFPEGASEIRTVPAWKRYGPVVALFIVIGLASASGGGGGGTSIEVAW